MTDERGTDECKKCPRRHPGCQDNCDTHKKRKIWDEILKIRRNKDKELNDYENDRDIRVTRRMLWHDR